MEELSDNDWKLLSGKAARKLAEALGEKNVHVDDMGIHVRFDLRAGLEQFNRFGDLAADNRLVSLPKIKTSARGLVVESAPVESEVLIPRNQRHIHNVMLLAAQMPQAKAHAEGREIKRPITENEPEYALEKLTGVPWDHVQGSPYEGHVVEARVKPTGPIRVKQEHGVGYVIMPEGARGSMKVREWLEHQEAVEKKQGIEPRTLLPSDWVSRSGISRIEAAGEEIKRGLPKVFSRR